MQRSGKESRKRKRGKSDEANGTDDLSALQEMLGKSLQQENERFEKAMKMFQENQKMQMASLLPEFKDLMKDLLKEEPVNVTHVLFTFDHT